eukprot:2679368-Rhodomonas_salina.2
MRPSGGWNRRTAQSELRKTCVTASRVAESSQHARQWLAGTAAFVLAGVPKSTGAGHGWPRH